VQAPLPPQLPYSLTNSDAIAVSAAIISLVSLFINIYSSYLNKRLEIRFLKFGKLVIENLDELLKPLEEIFSTNGADNISTHIASMSEALVDVELFIINFNQYYPSLNISTLSEAKDLFTDHLYTNPATRIKDSKINYLAFKTYVYNELYDYARRTNTGPIDRLWAKIKAWPLWRFFAN
jgi:hypothetical protein